MNCERSCSPVNLIDPEILIASSYRKENHRKEIQKATFSFDKLGLSTYPAHGQTPIDIDPEFVFFGKNIEAFGNNKRRIEIEFLKAINRAKLVYVITTNGYLGQSASIEVGFAMLMDSSIALSEPITQFDEKVPPDIKQIIADKQHSLSILPIQDIQNLNMNDSIFTSSEEREFHTGISEEDKTKVLQAIRSLTRELQN
jgi:hypothetical protein